MDRPKLEWVITRLGDKAQHGRGTMLENESLLVAQYAIEQEREAALMEKALKLSCEKFCHHMRCCPAEIISDFNQTEFACQDNCDLDTERPLTCWVKYFKDEAERQLKEGQND
jgi:hypothetical protein